MRIPRRTFFLLAALCLAASGALGAENANGERRPRVTYVTGTTVYLDAGSDAGIGVGDRLEIMRGDSVVARVIIQYLATADAACTILEKTTWPRSGDEAVLVSGGPTPPPPAPKAPAPITAGGATTLPGGELPPGDRPVRSASRIRGRIGAQYAAMDSQSEFGSSYRRPGVTLNLIGDRLGGGEWGIQADVRVRRTYRDLPDGSTPSSSKDRVYALALSWGAAEQGWRVSAGRQVSPDLAAVSVFDGVLLRRGGASWSLGLFGGTQPDPVNYGFSSDIREFGAFGRYDSRRTMLGRWSVTTGLVGSYQGSDLNREYLYIRSYWNGRRSSATFSQEVDINRGWKSDAGEPLLSPTNTFAFVRREIVEPLYLEAGFDNRRLVRLFRDRVTPETDFDDGYRQGAWIGASGKLGRDTRLSIRGSSRSGGVRSYSGTAKTRMPRLRALDLQLRSTRYENTATEGWLHSFSAGCPVMRLLRLDLTRGFRREESLGSPGGARSFDWLNLDVEITLPRHWRAYASVESDWGGGEDYRTIYSGVQYRF